jgi:hypothetical protein
MLRPAHFIGEEIEVVFDEPPMLQKKPGCPDGIVWQGTTLRVRERIDEWTDYSRRGRFARNMQPGHAAVAANRGSWGVGRMFFRVRVEDGRYFELYYDRAPKGAQQRKGAWFLRCELNPS